MKWAIRNAQASSMCYIGDKGIAFISSSGVKQIELPEKSKPVKLSSVRHARLMLSSDNKYLALLDPQYRFELFDTNDLSCHLITKSWKDSAANMGLMSFSQYNSILIAVQNVLYSLDIQKPHSIRLVYGDEMNRPIRKIWDKVGHIISLSVFKDEVVILHQLFEPFRKVAVRLKGPQYTIIDIRELPMDLQGKYNQLVFDQKGGICLFSSIVGEPMLYFKDYPADFLTPDVFIKLPRLERPCFSNNGKFLTFTAQVSEDSYPEGWLLSTKDWRLLVKVNDRIVVNPSFSNDSKYWLVPGKKPTVYDIESNFSIKDIIVSST